MPTTIRQDKMEGEKAAGCTSYTTKVAWYFWKCLIFIF